MVEVRRVTTHTTWFPAITAYLSWKWFILQRTLFGYECSGFLGYNYDEEWLCVKRTDLL